jgi:hypothetical protein
MDTTYNSENQLGYTLFSTDKYLTKGEITCFESLLKCMPGAEHDELVNPRKYKDDRAQHMKSICDLFVDNKNVYSSVSTFS